MDLFDIRKDYRQGHLSLEDLNHSPLYHIEAWLKEAQEAECLEYNSVVLSTASLTGAPSSRVVLLKRIDSEGLYIFTNYNSRKGQQLEVNNQAALLFFWPELERQINIEGRVEKCTEALSDDYFNQRPLSSRVSAAASAQSQPVESREAMLEKWQKAQARAEKHGIARPIYWGGYLIRPSRVEFWQGGAHRFHDRILFTLENDQWTKTRLMP